MAIIPARVDGIDAVIIGFGPGSKPPLAPGPFRRHRHRQQRRAQQAL